MKKICLVILLVLILPMVVWAYKMPSKGTTTASALNVRTGPGVSYKVLQTIPQGTNVDITAVSGSWYKVSFPGRTDVYVHSAYVKVTELVEIDDPEAEKDATKRFMPTLSVVDPSTR